MMLAIASAHKRFLKGEDHLARSEFECSHYLKSIGGLNSYAISHPDMSSLTEEEWASLAATSCMAVACAFLRPVEPIEDYIEHINVNRWKFCAFILRGLTI